MTTSHGRCFRHAFPRLELNEHGKDAVLIARALQIHEQRCRRAVACVSFHIKQRKILRACEVLVMPSVKACYQKGVTVHACNDVIYASHLRTCVSEMVLKTVSLI